MSNKDYKELNMDELDMVAGGIRVLCSSGQIDNTVISDMIGSQEPNIVGIPRGGKVHVRV